MPKSILALRHVAFEDLGGFAAVAERRGYKLRYADAARDDFTAIDPLQPDLVAILGGLIGAYDDDSYPFLIDELRLIDARLRAERPMLGLCLGAQLMARALGARVYPGPHKEIGWGPVSLTEAGLQSPLAQLGSPAMALHWHGDTFDLPPGAALLASTPFYENQAFSHGPAALGLQFHPEAEAATLERWFIGHACEIGAATGVTVVRLRADTRLYAPESSRRGRAMFEAWLDRAGI